MAKKSSALSQPDLPSDPNTEDTTAPVWVRTRFDVLNPPERTAAQKVELEGLRGIKDEDIDFSDIPRRPEGYVGTSVRNPHYARALKEQLTIRLDADILDWFKRHAKDGKGYQTDINKALRAYVEAQERNRAAAAE